MIIASIGAKMGGWTLGESSQHGCFDYVVILPNMVGPLR